MTAIFRQGLLDGRRIALVAPARPELEGALAGLGAEVLALAADPADEPAAEAAVAALGEVHVLVVDAAALFTGASDASSDELSPLRAAADGAWAATRPVANQAWIETRRPGKVVFVAPAPGDGQHAEAARAALENMARTLSIEWSRHGIRTVTITPGPRTAASEVADLVAYLASPGGDYFSGARLDLA